MNSVKRILAIDVRELIAGASGATEKLTFPSASSADGAGTFTIPAKPHGVSYAAWLRRPEVTADAKSKEKGLAPDMSETTLNGKKRAAIIVGGALAEYYDYFEQPAEPTGYAPPVVAPPVAPADATSGDTLSASAADAKTAADATTGAPRRNGRQRKLADV